VSSPAFLHAADAEARRAAIDPARSLIVRAPAGSGKTELLIQRFLRLLAIVQKPEAVVAITFTRKAAGEMLNRVLDALRAARDGAPVDKPHEQVTRELASAALARSGELGWDLLANPGRLRIQTIDSLCLSIVSSMPWLARFGALPRIEEDARPLFDEAARRTLLENRDEYRDPLEILLRHLDNDAAQARSLISTMLAKRDQWIDLAAQAESHEREVLEAALQRSVAKILDAAERLISPHLRGEWLALANFAARNLGKPELEGWPGADPERLHNWLALADLVLKKDGDWRTRVDARNGFPPGSGREQARLRGLIQELSRSEGCSESLKAVRDLPPPHYTPAQWTVLRAILQCLRLAVAHLRVIFGERRVIDFMELGIAARHALGELDGPSELAFHLDSRIEHLLVDEFQDTSRAQFELLKKLTSGWDATDGRTLFLVGDPMQSIYRFRQAEVGLFLRAERDGVGPVQLETRSLALNYRSLPVIVGRVNEIFSCLFPGAEDLESGAVRFTDAQAAQGGLGEVTLDAFAEGEDRAEAQRVVERVLAARAEDPGGSIAILVRARTHGAEIAAALKDAGLKYRAVELDPLGGRPIVRDLLTLTQAMLHRAGRIAWLAILRAPWCGLTLADLEALVRGRKEQTVWECLHDLSPLSEDGRSRAERVRHVLSEAFAAQGRWPLRRWVERVWIRLGGPACLEGDSSALRDAQAYFDLLEAEQSGTDLRDFDQFHKRVEDLFAQPDAQADGGLQIMTIHKAKGLEFDTVILPGLGRIEKLDDKPLILFHEWPDDGGMHCLLAPIDQTGGRQDPLYEHLRRIERRKGDFERVRQLYVAMTRARKRLHLMGHIRNKGDHQPKPASRSMLADLWLALSGAERDLFRRDAGAAGIPGAPRVNPLRRVPEFAELPPMPAPVHWEGAGPLPPEPHQPTFEWVSESLRRAGTVVHLLVQRMRQGVEPAPDIAVIRRMLAHAGVAARDLETMARRVQAALVCIETSPRARWILKPRESARAEYSIAGVVDGEIIRGTVDRTFVEDGIRWIVDFKTSAHEGGSLEAFLDEQQRRYRDQMDRYAKILALAGEPVRVGLYFPLLDQWREWTPDSAT
jgi:ATP-dependent helicase/nuclease subunit A